MSIGIAIPALNGEKELRKLLPIVCSEPGISDILVVDSASTDATCDVVRGFPKVRLIEIPRKEFNHGATRELARKELATEVVVFLTQDIVPVPGFIEPLVRPILDGQAAVTYARQLPHEGADILESFPRNYNYPPESHRRTLADAKKHGVFTFFCSDSCAAYSNSAVDSVGGITPILTNEDYFTVAKLLRSGEAICYVAESRVHHSHSYSLKQEFQRYFDTGYVRGETPWVNRLVGQAEGHGAGFVRALVTQVTKTAPWKLPYAIMQSGAKWIGYRLGSIGPRLPESICLVASAQKHYWGSIWAERASEVSRRR
ncbi:glycosyl transferase, group 2 family protein [Rhodopirellula baltica SH28]|uniref:Glycosyl transferase, group 2 family protein n=1 Tax=Rhodopirellula baltica SH28 TaxID=993517 RepID=K5D054_RHOBT|nr:glycosyl transferase, group 2 family protein [Rhodopirellula baltica SH28]